MATKKAARKAPPKKAAKKAAKKPVKKAAKKAAKKGARKGARAEAIVPNLRCINACVARFQQCFESTGDFNKCQRQLVRCVQNCARGGGVRTAGGGTRGGGDVLIDIDDTIIE